jgi:UDP-glucose 4-epimerase
VLIIDVVKGSPNLKILIAGGAGFIGSTLASACLDAGMTPVIVDNLVQGRREFVTSRNFFEGDIRDGELIDNIFEAHPDIEAAVLCAALISVPNSVIDPISYYDVNVSSALSFVSHLIRNNCLRLVFSSSAAIYRTEDVFEVDESSVIEPQNPYARTKAVCEKMFQDIANASPLRVLSLRYFNPIGADPLLRTGLQYPYPSHALGKMIVAMEDCRPFEITGTDFPTRDGTGVRDYVHVWDVVNAHVLAISKFESLFHSGIRHEAINIGSGFGTTVRELVGEFNSLIPSPIAIVDAPRRLGDNVGAYANIIKAASLLGWTPTYKLVDGIRDSLRWAKVRRDVLGE